MALFKNLDEITIKTETNKAKNKKTNPSNVIYRPYIGKKRLSFVGDSKDVALIIGLCCKYADASMVKILCRILRIDSMWSS